MSHPPPSSTFHSPGRRHATHPCLHIRNAADAHAVFEAVRLNILPMIRRRLGPSERDLLRSGEVFVWEETDQKGGLERWTDGRRWSQSRMREPFLYYEEKEPTTREEKEAKAARRAYRNADPSAPPLSPSRRQDRPSKPDGLTKQTYSTYVNTGHVSRKWHLVAYFSGADFSRLPVVDDYDYLRRLRIPSGTYVSAKELNVQSDNDEGYEDDHRSSYQARGQSYSAAPSSSRPSPVVSLPVPHPPPSLYSSTPNGHARYHSGAHIRSLSHVATEKPDQYPSSFTYTSQNRYATGTSNSQTPKTPSDSSKQYIPLTSEDRRALGAFRVAL